MGSKLRIESLFLLCFTLAGCVSVAQESTSTYAEKLGFPKGSKVLILHVDDVGMSWDSNQGAIEATTKGVANSVSMMMPCPWIPGFFHYLKNKPQLDAGLHLTLTSEWQDYRWGPLSGKKTTPGLVDKEGALWSSVDAVIKNASADEVETEIRAQIERSRAMDFEPTHLDSHMGTLFANPAFFERYLKVGIEYKIPVMIPGGHGSSVGGMLTQEAKARMKQAGQKAWEAGLPVLDDLFAGSYGFTYPKGNVSEGELQKIATKQYIEAIKNLKPGLTMVIMHCTNPSPVFTYISDSGNLRKGDLLAMTDPAFKKFLTDEKIILTTWREVAKRRKDLK